jgi:hypothetical protein
MNILKLAKYLKEFTLDEISMIAECDVNEDLKRFLRDGKLTFDDGKYKYIEQEIVKTFELNQPPELKAGQRILFKDMVYAYLSSKKLTKSTIKGYKSILKFNILPYFGDLFLEEIMLSQINDFMQLMKDRYKPKTASNCVTLTGSILKFAFEKGLIEHNPYLGVKNSKCR